MTNDTLKNYFINGAVLIALLVLFEGVSAYIGFATMNGVDGWYQTINRSPLNPPGWVFGVVWPALYALMAVSVWLIWMRRHSHIVAPALMLFGLHMVFNWAWNFIFFNYHMLFLSFIWIPIILSLVVALFFIFRTIRPLAAWLLVPYMGWLSFAGYLALYIWRHN